MTTNSAVDTTAGICSICTEALPEGTLHKIDYVEDIQDTDVKIHLACEHVFCRVCISEWFERKPNCPLCRHIVEYRLPPPNNGGSSSWRDLQPFVREESLNFQGIFFTSPVDFLSWHRHGRFFDTPPEPPTRPRQDEQVRENTSDIASIAIPIQQQEAIIPLNQRRIVQIHPNAQGNSAAARTARAFQNLFG